MLIVVIADFIPVKFAKKIDYSKEIYMHKPKLVTNQDVEFVMYEYANKQTDYNKREYYIIKGDSPVKVLNKRSFDIIALYNMPGDKTNKFYIKQKGKIVKSKSEPDINVIYAIDWDILYPINRATFRRFYAPKSYLTIYDYDWGAVLKRYFGS